MSVWQLVLIQIITFLAIIFALRKLLYTQSAEEIKRLQELNRESGRRLQELNEKIKESEEKKREKIKEAEEEAKRLREEAEEEARRLKEEILSKAKEERERIIELALRNKERLREEIAEDMRARTGEVFAEVLAQIIPEQMMRAGHKEMSKEFLRDIERLESAHFSNLQVEKADLVSAYPLEEREAERIVQVLCRKTGYNLSLEKKVDKRILAGLKVRLGSLVIENTLLSRLKKAIEKISY